MEKMIYLNNLYDYYKDMFTEKQQYYFEQYYQNNLSLAEIAEIDNVSRNAVHNQLKIVEAKLEEYERIFKLLEKKNKIIDLLDKKISSDLLEKVVELL